MAENAEKAFAWLFLQLGLGLLEKQPKPALLEEQPGPTLLEHFEDAEEVFAAAERALAAVGLTQVQVEGLLALRDNLQAARRRALQLAGGAEACCCAAARAAAARKAARRSREIITHPALPMLLLVRRPDYLGHAWWEFRQGTQTIRARIAATAWLKAFQQGQISIQAGDTLRCMVSRKVRYGAHSRLLSESYTIHTVAEVIRGTAPSVQERRQAAHRPQ